MNLIPDQFSEFIKILPEPMLLVSGDGEILDANPSFSEAIGVERQILIGKSLLEFAASDRAQITQYLKKCSKTRQMLFGSIEWLREDGQISAFRCEGALLHPRSKASPAFILLRFKPKNSASGEFVLLTQKINELNKEIAERKRSEVALKESEKRFRQLADSMPQIVWTARPDGYLDYYNRRWYEFTGFPEGEYGDRSWEKLLHPEDVNHCYETWYGSVESGRGYEIEYRFKDYRTGDYRWFLGRADAIRDETGRIVKWFGTCTDINEQKLSAIERERLFKSESEARKNAEKASRLKDEFLATVSHELRTPLNAVLGWGTIALSSYDNRDTVKNALEIIVRNARSQNQIISDILDVSKIIAGKVSLDIKPVEIATVISAALDSIRPALEAKKIRLKTTFGAQTDLVSGDVNRLQQIVWNLISNAVKFTPPEGEIEVILASDGNYAEITIRDTGEGISPDFLPYIFDRFSQADGSTKRRHGGLGLGLAIVRQLVELQGGSIHVESRGQDLGATFKVRLPLAFKQEETQSLTSLSKRDAENETLNTPEIMFTGLRVLVVDDENDARELMRTMLSHYGAEVYTAGSVKEALEKLNEKPPDVLISDIGMPGSDGYELIKSIRNFPQTKTLAAIALTAYARKEDYERALAEGFDAHLSKPVEVTELIKTVVKLKR